MAKNTGPQNFGYLILFGLLVWPMLATFAPRIEGKLYPVVVSTELTQVRPIDETNSMIYGAARKVRDCSYIRIEWYYGDPNGRHVLVPLDILEPSKIRGDGQFSFGPWQLNLGKDLVREETFALVYHDCHPFWPTVSQFWP